MFGKLLKYEWKAMMKTMLPIYGATMVLAAVNGFLFQSILGGWIDRSALFSTMQTTALTLYMLILMIMGVFTAVMIVQRFYKGLLRQEGYLMFSASGKDVETDLLQGLRLLCRFCLVSGSGNPVHGTVWRS